MTTTTSETELLGVVLTPRQIWELLDLVNDTPGDADEEVLVVHFEQHGYRTLSRDVVEAEGLLRGAGDP